MQYIDVNCNGVRHWLDWRVSVCGDADGDADGLKL